MRAAVKLRSGHVQPVWTGHPWVFAQAVATVDGAPEPGDEVDVLDPRGAFLGRGLYTPGSAIPVRIFTRKDEPVDARLIRARLDHAIALRRDVLGLPSAETTGYRLINSEGDGVPGLIVDVYGSLVAVQALTAGVARRLPDVYDAIQATLSPSAIVAVAPPSRIAAREKLAPDSPAGGPGKDHPGRAALAGGTGVVRGGIDGPTTFLERGLRLSVQLAGQKTGFYLDQRENRALVEQVSKGRRVLDAYTFTGGFALAAARGGASEVIAVDSSVAALALASEHAVMNGLSDRIRFHRGDVRKNLGEIGDHGKPFDLVILDPPKLAEGKKDLQAALRVYRHVNAMAMRRLAPGGLLVTCSCSQVVSGTDFVRAVALAARDAERTATILRLGGQSPDHPVPVAFPEGRYLKLVMLSVS
ncbi:MAG: class I SAM-dependent rRNA methyltransferase [Deltaproteobacteria bacterium]|nr:class I SAM-dependent rRNA methyltransferase [Deltaproteobacteria bacterium]